MFGKAARRTPHSQAGPSQDNAERQDETKVSATRQGLVVGLLDVEGAQGLTIRELSKKMREATGGEEWHHGQSSMVLSTLDVVGRTPTSEWGEKDIVRLDEKRSGQSVYVLVMHRLGRPLAVRHKSRAVVLQQELADAQAMIEGLQATVEDLSARVTGLDEANDRQRELSTRYREAYQEEKERAATAEATAQAVRETAAVAARDARLATERLEQVQGELDQMTRENAALRVDRHLRMSMTEQDGEVVVRILSLLDRPDVAAKPDTDLVQVGMNVLRVFARLIRQAVVVPVAEVQPGSTEVQDGQPAS
jgi:hypothetical protein